MKIKFLILVSFAVLSPTLASAESWDWRVTPFLWTAGIDGDATVGPVVSDIDVGFGDILDNFKFGALVHIEAHQPAYGLFGDIVYLSLGADGSNPAGEKIDVDVKSLFVEAGAIWKVFSDEQSGLEFGARYYDQDIRLDPPNLDRVSRGKAWVDGFVGFRWILPLGERWSFMARANVGAGGSDLAWSLNPTFFRELNNGNQLALGFRVLDVDFDDQSRRSVPFETDLTYSGFIFGYTFN